MNHYLTGVDIVRWVERSGERSGDRDWGSMRRCCVIL